MIDLPIPDGDYTIPEKCPDCESRSWALRVCFKAGHVYITCNECGWRTALAKEQNKNQRTNTPLAHWAYNIRAKSRACFICGRTQNLEAHHIIPVSHSEKYKYDEANGIMLCQECHSLVHHKPN